MTWGDEDLVDTEIRDTVAANVLKDLGWVAALLMVGAALIGIGWLIAQIVGLVALVCLVVFSAGLALALPRWMDDPNEIAPPTEADGARADAAARLSHERHSN